MNRSYRTYPGRILRPPRGMCRWCGLLIKCEDGTIDRTKQFCGPVCLTHFQLRADPAKMREHIFFRDGGKCARCGTVHPYLQSDWEADHVLPLMIAEGNPDFWDPDNLVVLCTKPCHADKSGEDRRLYRHKFRQRFRKIFKAIYE